MQRHIILLQAFGFVRRNGKYSCSQFGNYKAMVTVDEYRETCHEVDVATFSPQFPKLASVGLLAIVAAPPVFLRVLLTAVITTPLESMQDAACTMTVIIMRLTFICIFFLVQAYSYIV
jgi:hypothetical protein